MKVHVRLFAGLRDAIGAREVAVELPEGASVYELKARLGETYPAVQPMLDRVVCAIDDEYVSADERVRDGADVAECVHDDAPVAASVRSSTSSAPTRSTKTSSRDGSATSKRMTSPFRASAACSTA